MNVEKYLRNHDVWFELIEHKPTFSASTLAHVVQTMEQEVAKPVMVCVDDGLALVVVPASATVDLELVKEVLGAESVYLATESECGHEFVDCEFGARLPFGSEYGLRTVMDESLLDDEEIVFEGNTHRQAIRMKLADFVELEKPFRCDRHVFRPIGITLNLREQTMRPRPIWTSYTWMNAPKWDFPSWANSYIDMAPIRVLGGASFFLVHPSLVWFGTALFNEANIL